MKAWYEESFGNDYLIVYKHRDLEHAYEEVERMIAWLDLPQGAEVLDLCCGMGRHALALTEFGYRVTGLDLSQVLLDKAIELDTEQRVEWLAGDMRQLPLADEQFDAVVNLFTSFGYFSVDSENAGVLKEMARVLRPGGRFIIDFLNPAYTIANLVPHSERTIDQYTVDEKRAIVDGYVKKTIVMRQPGEEPRQYQEQVRLYEIEDFRRMLLSAGLVLEAEYGYYDERPYDKASAQRMIMVGRKLAVS